MFTPSKIEGALERLFDLFDADVMAELYENHGEEIEDISPKWLAKAFKEQADTVYEFRAVCRVGDGLNYHGKVLFNQRAVNLLSYLENSIENERLRMIYCTELWLLEDMTFAVVHYMGTLVKDGDDADCVTEYRSFVKNIESEDDVFFTPEDLICALDDTCMFAQVVNEATIYEP